MHNFNQYYRRLRRAAYNFWFYSTIGRLASTKKALQVDLTASCNLRCQGCYHFASPTSDDLADKEILAFLRQKKATGYKKLWLFGGEPTLRDNLFPVIDRWFWEIHIISNGQIKIPRHYDWKLWISLDGPANYNDGIRGKGTFNMVVNNYQGDTRVGLVMTVNRQNYQLIPEMVELVKQLGVKTISFTFYSCCEGATDDSLDFLPADLKAIEAILTEQLKTNGQYILLDHATLHSLLYEKVSSDRWQGKCYFASQLVECYSSDGQQKKCCTANVACPTCRILPPHQTHQLFVTKNAPWLDYAFK